MRRLPLVASFLLFIALCASLAYWGMQLFKPPLRPVAAPPRSVQADIRPEAAAAVFGGRRGNVAVASNYQLQGVIFSGSPHDSVAILSTDGKPAQAIRVDKEVVPGVTVKEVHRDYVLLSEGGAVKRVELPESAKGQGGIASASPAPVQRATPPMPGQAIPSRAQAAATPAPPAVPATPPAAMTPTPTPTVPSMPGAMAPQAQMPQPVPPGQIQVPAPPAATAPPTVVISPPPSAQTGGVPVAPSATIPAPVTGLPQTQAPATTPVPGAQALPGMQQQQQQPQQTVR